MIAQYALRILLTAVFLLFAGMPLLAQATFGVASLIKTGADIGIAELTGEIMLTIVSGTTLSGPLTIGYSAPLTNNAAGEIEVTGTGGLASISPAPNLSRPDNTISILVPAGGVPGNTIRIRGARVALAGLQASRVTASVSAPAGTGNVILGGQNVTTVIDPIMPPFSTEVKNDVVLSFSNGYPVNAFSSLVIREGYPDSFTSDVGVFGQTAAVRFRIRPFPPLAAGVRLSFDARADAAGSASYLLTSSGGSETVPRADGTTDVVYEFVGGTGHAQNLESFEASVTLAAVPAAGSGFATFQIVMEPVGLAVPTAQYPSTDIPRYMERILPDEADLRTGVTELQFPFRSLADGLSTGIAVTNPADIRAKVKLSAYGHDGQMIAGAGITNPVEVILPRRGQFGRLASEIFGPGFNATSAGTIRLEGNKPALAGFYLQGDETWKRLDGATADVNSQRSWVWPIVFRGDPSPFTTLEIFNPGTQAATAILNLFDANGIPAAPQAAIAVQPGGTVIRSLSEVFPGASLGSFSGGYVTGEADRALVARETFGNSREFNTLQAYGTFSGLRFHSAHFATGGGYTSELTLVNMDPSLQAVLTLTAMGSSGSAFSIPGNPVRISLPPRSQLIRTVSSLFPALPGSLTTGYIRIEMEPYYYAYFIITPPLAGAIRFSSTDGMGSATLPLFIPLDTDFVYSHVAQNPGYFTGVAILNSEPTPATVNLALFRADGSPVGSYSITLQGGEKIAKLLFELIPASAGQQGGHLRITSTLPVTSFSLFGTSDGSAMGAIPPPSLIR